MVPKAEPVVGREEERRAAELSRGEKRLRGGLCCAQVPPSLSPLRSLLDAGRTVLAWRGSLPSFPTGFVAFEAFFSSRLALQVDGVV